MPWFQEEAPDGTPLLVNEGDTIAIDPDGDVVVTIDDGGRPVWVYVPFELVEALVREERARRDSGRFQRPLPIRGPGGDGDDS